MQSNTSDVQIEITPEFKKNLRELKKKYRKIQEDVQTVIEQLRMGRFPGTRISGLCEDCVIFKERIRNSNLQKGKSGGYRIIYLLESSSSVLLLTIYSKLDQDDIRLDRIKEILDDFYKE